MPEVLVISGKGGTGKTSLTAAFAHLADHPTICDLDVDAPDLHLLLHPDQVQPHDFFSGFEARIQPDLCQGCDTCRQMCQFDAIQPGPSAHVVDSLKCEGCKVCVTYCPSEAIAFTSKHCGIWYTSGTRFGPMVHAQLFPGEENSGRLVSLLRQKAKEMGSARGNPLIISDGPPGIGCPVISALSGVDLAVIVTEPTPSGRHDMERIITLCSHFKLEVVVIVNKCDLNVEIAQQIESICFKQEITVVAELPHDTAFFHAMLHGKAVTENSDSALVRKIEKAWDQIEHLVLSRPGFRCKNPGAKRNAKGSDGTICRRRRAAC